MVILEVPQEVGPIKATYGGLSINIYQKVPYSVQSTLLKTLVWYDVKTSKFNNSGPNKATRMADHSKLTVGQASRDYGKQKLTPMIRNWSGTLMIQNCSETVPVHFSKRFDTAIQLEM